ncbi:MAG: NAD(P)H-dependent oxidoreductase [Alphaproteobacteria bacterium]
MGGTARILAFAGSARDGSFNKKLIRIAADGARDAGAAVILLDLRDYEMPIYDGDLEENNGLPENALRLRGIFAEHDGLLIAAPEYNSSITPLLKNVIDWVSRPSGDDAALKYIAGKTAALVATAPGALGGLRGLVHVRQILGNIQVTVLPNQVTVPGARSAFKEDGSLADEGQQKAVRAAGAALATVTAKLVA